MELFYATEFVVPMSQITLLLMLSTLALLFGKIRLALLINYIFTMYWAYFLNREMFYHYFKNIEYITYIYFGFGLAIVFFAMAGFMAHKKI